MQPKGVTPPPHLWEDGMVPVVNLPLMRFIGGTTNQEINGNNQGAWDPEIYIAVITTVGVPVEEALVDIGIKYRNALINMECDEN